eukprot:3634494-Pyramimonas_sp.AAC.1
MPTYVEANDELAVALGVPTGAAFKIKKAAHGLWQATKSPRESVDAVMEQLGCQRCASDPR